MLTVLLLRLGVSPAPPLLPSCVCVCVCARNLRTLQSSNLASHYKAFRRKMSSWAKTCSDELKQAENDKLSLIRDKHIQWYLNQSNGGKQKKQRLISRDGQREREREREGGSRGTRRQTERQKHKWMDSMSADRKCENSLKKTSLRGGNGAGQTERLTQPLYSVCASDKMPLGSSGCFQLIGLYWSPDPRVSAAAPPRGSALFKERPERAGPPLLLLLPVGSHMIHHIAGSWGFL